MLSFSGFVEGVLQFVTVVSVNSTVSFLRSSTSTQSAVTLKLRADTFLQNEMTVKEEGTVC